MTVGTSVVLSAAFFALGLLTGGEVCWRVTETKTKPDAFGENLRNSGNAVVREAKRIINASNIVPKLIPGAWRWIVDVAVFRLSPQRAGGIADSHESKILTNLAILERLFTS